MEAEAGAAAAAPEVAKAPIVFKKRRKRRNVRKSQTLKEVEKEEEADESADKEALENIKFLQKARRRTKGVDANAVTVEGAAPTTVVQRDDQGAILADAFAADTQDEEQEKSIKDKQLEKYIEEEMAKRRGIDLKELEKAKVPEKSAEEKLYETPAHLRGRQMEEEMGESGDRWLTGIAEVQLDISYKIANIEATEKAKAAKFDKAKYKKPSEDNADLPTNYSANFKQHKKDWDRNFKQKLDRARRANGEAPEPQRKRHGGMRATDDRTVAAYLKRQRR